jgi:mannose-6-phosphate isomerase
MSGPTGTRPLRLPPNQLHRFYLGGPRISALRGTKLADDHTPEEWVGSANTSFGQQTEGLSRLEDGTFVRDAIEADPEAFLGPEHVARYGTDPALLVKLLDAGERLPVHYHPGRAFAREHLDSAHGKTEAWLIVEADPGAEVRVGFKAEPGPDTLAKWLADQDSQAMLDALHPVAVKAGDAVFVPAGTAHAIGAGILMVELQEPTDFSIVLEHDAFGITDEAGATLGLGWDKAIQALDRQATDAPEPSPTLPDAAAAYFRAERLQAPATLDQGFSIVVVLDGSGRLGGVEVGRGDTLLVPHGAGATRLEGNVAILRCRPPAPDAPEGAW